MFTVSAMSAVFILPCTDVPTIWGKRILLSASVWVLTVTENLSAAVLSYAMPYLVVVVHICLLITCHVCTDVLNAPAGDLLAMLWAKPTEGGVILASGVASIRLAEIAPEVGSCSVSEPWLTFTWSNYLGVCYPTAAVLL